MPFDPGFVTITGRCLRDFAGAYPTLMFYLFQRHCQGDWGEVEDLHRRVNFIAAGSSIAISRYRVHLGFRHGWDIDAHKDTQKGPVDVELRIETDWRFPGRVLTTLDVEPRKDHVKDDPFTPRRADDDGEPRDGEDT